MSANSIPCVAGLLLLVATVLGDIDPEGQIMAYLDTRLANVAGDLVHEKCPSMASVMLVSTQ